MSFQLVILLAHVKRNMNFNILFVYVVHSVWLHAHYITCTAHSDIIHFWDLERGITMGKTLQGSTVRKLQSGRYNVEASGAVENYSKWPVKLVAHETAGGVERKYLPSVIERGTVEGFASRKSSGAATGVWMRYSMVVDDDIYIHFMYSVPYSQDFSVNWLAVATCSHVNAPCRVLTADKMYYHNYPFMDKKSFYTDTRIVKKCYDNICVSGWMEHSHTPVVRIKILPRSFYALAPNVREKLVELTPKEYEDYIKSLV